MNDPKNKKCCREEGLAAAFGMWLGGIFEGFSEDNSRPQSGGKGTYAEDFSEDCAEEFFEEQAAKDFFDDFGGF